MPHFGSPLEPSLVPIPSTPPTSFPQPIFPGPTFGGDFSDPFGAPTGPAPGPLGTPASPVVTVIPTTAEERFQAEQDAFIRQLLLAAQLQGPAPATGLPITVPPSSTLPPDLVPIPGAPGVDLEPFPLDPFFNPDPSVFTESPTVAARPPTEDRVVSEQRQQILADLVRFILQLFGPSGSSSGGAGVGSAVEALISSLFPGFVPSFATGGSMPNVSTSIPARGSGFFGDLIEGVGDFLGDVFRPGPQPTRVPTGPTLFPTVARPIQAQPVGFVGDSALMIAEAAAGAAGGACIVPSRGPATLTLPQRVDVPTRDSSGNMRFTTYKNMGRAILFAGDFAAVKRVKKVASRARRASGGR